MNPALASRGTAQDGSTDPPMGRSTAHRSPESGFTLLEVIVATAIMAIAVIGMLSLISGSLANAARVKEYDRAAMLAKHQMGELLASDPLPLGTELSGNFDNASGWRARANRHQGSTRPVAGQAMLVRIQLTIWWDSEGRRKTVDFETYRRMMGRSEFR